jgi:hypothetical protein
MMFRIVFWDDGSLMMEAARTSETLVDNYFTRQYIPEDNSELHTCRRENLKSHLMNDGYQKHNPFYGRIQVHLHEKAL